MPDTDTNTKRYYTLFLSIAFIGIGGWKLYEKFVEEQEMEAYKWILGAGLMALGIYQLVGLYLKKR